MKDLVGKKFNMLTVIELSYIKDHTYPSGYKSKIPYFNCLCDCGNYTVVRQSELKPDRTKSCGCLSLKKEVLNLEGMKFGRFLAIKRSERKGNYWECICDCGTERTVSSKTLRNGSSKSCGCLASDLNKARAYDLTGDVYGRLVVINKSEKGGIFWDCLCSCGNSISTSSKSLKSGYTKSCGCLREETAKSNIMTFINKIREEQGLPIDENISSNDKIERARFIPLAREIYARDGFCCVWCSKTGSKLNAHHLETWATTPDKRFDKTNLVTLCEDCHFTAHNNSWYSLPNPYMTLLLQGYTKIMEDKTYADLL